MKKREEQLLRGVFKGEIVHLAASTIVRGIMVGISHSVLWETEVVVKDEGHQVIWYGKMRTEKQKHR